MKVGEFARRARASRLNKKSGFEAAIKKARRELHSARSPWSAPPANQRFLQRKIDRPTLTLFPQTSTSEPRKEA
jgi:hypothetical protein